VFGVQTTTNAPSYRRAIAGAPEFWFVVVVEMWNTVPSAVPLAESRWPKRSQWSDMKGDEDLPQTTAKSPLAVGATAVRWSLEVAPASTRNAVPLSAPPWIRCAMILAGDTKSYLSQTTTNCPAACPTTVEIGESVVDGLTASSSPSAAPVEA